VISESLKAPGMLLYGPTDLLTPITQLQEEASTPQLTKLRYLVSMENLQFILMARQAYRSLVSIAIKVCQANLFLV
jgi:hypothetical protein